MVVSEPLKARSRQKLVTAGDGGEYRGKYVGHMMDSDAFEPALPWRSRGSHDVHLRMAGPGIAPAGVDLSSRDDTRRAAAKPDRRISAGISTARNPFA